MVKLQLFRLTLPGESVREAFIRRLRADDPMRQHFEKYIVELEDRMANATEVEESEISVKFIK